MHTYFVKFHDGRVGKGTDCWDACAQFMSPYEYNNFQKNSPTKGYVWSAYRSVQSKYETCTINAHGGQLAQVFRTDKAKVVRELEKKFAINAKTHRKKRTRG